MSGFSSDRYRMAALAWAASVATSFAFLPALQEKGFVATAAFVSALLVLLGCALRWVRTPPLLVLLGQLVSLLALLTFGYGQKLRYGLIPTGETIEGLRKSSSSAMDVAQTFAAPVPHSPGLTMVMVFYICLIAVVVDFLAVTLARVPLAGLPLLAMYAVPVAVLPRGVSFLLFLPGAAAFIAMLMVDERDRLAHWGRLVARGTSVESATRIDTSGLTATGRRISVLALATAVTVPLFVPVFGTMLFTGNGNGPGFGNGNDLSFADPMVSLASSLQRKDPVDILRVQSDVRPEYIRLVVLERPGPDAWTVGDINLAEAVPAGNLLPDPTGLTSEVARTNHRMNIAPTDAFPDDSSWLPLPFDAKVVDVGSVWSYLQDDQTATANTVDAAASLSTYNVSYDSVEPTDEQLQAAGSPPSDIMHRYTVVPDAVPQVVGDLARAVTSDARSHYEEAVLLQSWFRDNDNFSYDLDTGYGYGYDAMTQFLQKRRGFCQHFAATMAMMARELNIPSRVVVGFLQPERLDGGDWVITSQNVHAWPELYFDGVGWVRFDPTPSVGAPFPDWAPRVGAGSSLTTGPLPTKTGATETAGRQGQTTASTSAAGAAGDGAGGSGSAPSRWWLVAVLLVVLAMVPAIVRFGIRRNRMSRPLVGGVAAESAWAELRDHIRDLRLPWNGSMTPRARERAVAPMLGGDASAMAALHRLAVSVERARYAASPSAGSPAADAQTVMSVISRSAEPGQRARALLLPTSLLPDIRAGWQRLRSRSRRPVLVDR